MSDEAGAPSPSGHTELFTRGAPIGVDVAGIERELSSLWRKASERDAVTRACLWNLVVATRGEVHHTAMKELVSAVVPLVPARIIVVSEGRDGGPELEAWISANCQIAPGGGKLVCSEEVTLSATGAGVDHLPSLVRALTVPDVPSALVALGLPWPIDAHIQRLLPGVGRLVVDTATSGATAELGALASFARGVVVADFGWIRLGRFRWALASLFDPPVGAAPVREVRKIHLRAAAIGEAPSRLVLGWLCSRLGLGSIQRAGDREWSAKGPSGMVTLSITIEDIDGGRDGIYSIHLESARDGAEFCVSDAGPEHLELRATGLPTRVVAAPERSDAELLVASLGGRGNDAQLRTSLELAARLGA